MHERVDGAPHGQSIDAIGAGKLVFRRDGQGRGVFALLDLVSDNLSELKVDRGFAIDLDSLVPWLSPHQAPLYCSVTLAFSAPIRMHSARGLPCSKPFMKPGDIAVAGAHECPSPAQGTIPKVLKALSIVGPRSPFRPRSRSLCAGPSPASA